MGTNTHFKIHPSKTPGDHKIASAIIVATIHSQKTDMNHICITVGEEQINYEGITATDTTSVITLKIFINCVL